MGLIIGGVSARDLILDGNSVSLYVGGNPPVRVWPTAEVYEVTLTDAQGYGTLHPLLTVTVPAGQTWSVRVQGTMTRAGRTSSSQPKVRIGAATFGPYGEGAAVDCSGTVTSADTTIAILTSSGIAGTPASFVGTVTIEK
jgi:hypothetical protein